MQYRQGFLILFTRSLYIVEVINYLMKHLYLYLFNYHWDCIE